MDDLYYLETSLSIPLRQIFQCILTMIETDTKGNISKYKVKEIAKIIADVKKEERTINVIDAFDILVDDTIEEIMLKLDKQSLANLCYSSKKLLAICNKDTFKMKYDNLSTYSLFDWLKNKKFPKKYYGSKDDFISYISLGDKRIIRLESTRITIASKHDETRPHKRDRLDMEFNRGSFSLTYTKDLHIREVFQQDLSDIQQETKRVRDGGYNLIDTITKKFNEVFNEETFPKKMMKYIRKMGLKKSIIGKTVPDILADIKAYSGYIFNIIAPKDLEKGDIVKYDGRSVVIE